MIEAFTESVPQLRMRTSYLSQYLAEATVRFNACESYRRSASTW